MTNLAISEDQALHFRALRGHMAGPGAPDARTAARDILGAQAQAVSTGLLALAQRTAGRPSAAELSAQLLGPDRDLVRIWGQRGTMHIYDPDDWRAIIAAFETWSPHQRRGPKPKKASLDKALRGIDELALKQDLLNVAPATYLKELEAFHGKYLKTRDDTLKFAAGRLLYMLCLRGDVCVGPKQGSRQAYATRRAWFPSLPWPALDPTAAAVDLTRRYLAISGPATAKDVAHHFGARQREAKAWLAALEPELVHVACGDRKGLVALAGDADALSATPPKSWPLRLMPTWDTYLMGHADKSWTVPHEPDRKIVWRGSAMVAASVLHRGRVVAEWNHDLTTKELRLTVTPLFGWTKKHLPAVKREAKVIAAHHGRAKATVAIA